MPNQRLVEQYLRAIAKRALPIFQSNNFTYGSGVFKNIYEHLPTEEELYHVLTEIYRDFIKKHNKPRFKCVSLGRFHMFNSSSPIGLEVLLGIGDHEWEWHPEKVFKEQIQSIQEEELCQKTN